MARLSLRSFVNLPLRSAAALALICGAALTLGAPVALAQEDVAKNGRELAGGFDQPLQELALGGANVTMLFSKQEDGRAYELKIEGGKLTGKVDGETLPPERVRRTGDKVQLLGDNGEVLTEFGVGMGGFGDMQRDGTWRFQNRGRGPGDPLANAQRDQRREVERQAREIERLARVQVQPPPVMLGITMSEWGEGAGVEVDSVVLGLPASKAGVREGDVIKSIAGIKVGSREALTEVLRTLKSGDAVELVIVRDDKEETLKVTPEAFDRGRLGFGNSPAADPLAERLAQRWGNQGEEWYDEAVQQLKESMGEIKDSKELSEAKEHAKQAMEQALAALKQAREAMDAGSSRWLQVVPGGVVPGGQGQTLLSPREGDAGPDVLTLRRGDPFAPGGGPDVSRQMERLAEQLERLNQRLDRMEERLPQQGTKKE